MPFSFCRGEHRIDIWGGLLSTDVELVSSQSQDENRILLSKRAPPVFGREGVDQRGSVDRMGDQRAHRTEGRRGQGSRLGFLCLELDRIPRTLRDLSRLPLRFGGRRGVELRAN